MISTDEVTIKHCKHCGQLKPITDFDFSHGNPRARCTMCRQVQRDKRIQNHLEKRRLKGECKHGS